MVAGKGNAVGRHPVIGVGKGRREIERVPACHAVDAGLEGVALTAAQPLRQAPVGSSAGERHAHDGVAREAIVDAAGKARSAGGEVVASQHRGIAVGAVAAAIASAPHAPALLEGLRRRLLRGLEHGGIGEGDILRHRFALGRKADGASCSGTIAAEAAAAVDEGIEHEGEELVAELEGGLLGAGRGLARKLGERIAEIAAGQAEHAHESRRQRAAAVEEVVERIGDVPLIDAQAAGRDLLLPQRGGEVEDHVACGVAQIGGEACRQVGRGQGVECAVASARRRQDCVRT